MQIPFIVFGVDPRGSAVTCALLQQWPHMGCLDGFTLHFRLAELEQRGMTSACTMFGMLALGKLGQAHPRELDMLDPPPAAAACWSDTASNLVELIADRDAIRARHVAVGLTGSGLMLAITERDEQRTTGVERFLPVRELIALGAEAACLTVGDLILRRLIAQHPDAFAPYPILSFQPQDQP